jgi:hypothetical protein
MPYQNFDVCINYGFALEYKEEMVIIKYEKMSAFTLYMYSRRGVLILN